ncbi:uncharacterized protein DDB_G0271670 [Impatiens glandulifera]|uniref:uncharacterized protein DDB_G0271670 n=1 Tax=Impatiens glandulifera TaxID=253017 RepID=UPI001FB13C3E|nr:uncharacterized protein DDB_G0271670 [Impatiens glandulifera]
METKKILHRKLSDDQKKKKKTTIMSPRSPLQDLNGATGSISSSSSSSRGGVASSSSSSSSSLSTEAPIGIHRLFNSSSSTSGNVRKPRRLPATTTTGDSPSCFRSNRSNKENLPKQVKLTNVKTNPLKNNSSIAASKQKISADLRRKPDLLKAVKTGNESGVGAVEHTSTPTGKVACLGSSGQSGNKVVKFVEEGSISEPNNTPPIQQSVSPEIQGGSSISFNAAATPACYGTGHLLSGVTDRRKCRARGILAVGRYDPGCSNSINTADLHEFSSSSLVLEPLEASMRWLCCDEEIGEQKKDVSGLPSPSSPSSNQTRVPSLSGDDQVVEHFSVKDSSPATAIREVVTTSQERRAKQYDFLHEGNNWSPFSFDSLGSENVIQTPESDSISNHCKGVSLICFDSLSPHGDYHYPEIQSLEVLVRENFSPSPSPTPSSEEGILLPLDYDSSFQFSCPILSGNSVEHSQQLPSTEESSSSQASILLKYGLTLTSGTTDTDDPDCCRCFSDDEDDNYVNRK